MHGRIWHGRAPRAAIAKTKDCEKKPGRRGTNTGGKEDSGGRACRMRRGENWTRSTGPGSCKVEKE